MIANNLPVLLAKKTLKMNKVASDTGISRTTLSNLYNQKNDGITFDVLEKLCNYLNCNIGDLLELR